ncbi:YsnF/AvaK domain-containing protein [Bernardetia sp. ABR2-2B]|uniref:YsnF/AvaK domain-containing protein n=1 Tax=Bernardetia sp. ABR2-2B TaxID=3127472 RepID=UPI0030D3FEBD
MPTNLDSISKPNKTLTSQNQPQNKGEKQADISNREGHDEKSVLQNGFDKIYQEGEEVIIPVMEEKIHIEKEIIESGKVQIIKKVDEQKSKVEVPINHTEVQVERKAINKYVEQNPAAIRQEGDTTIVSVLKEVVVVQKKTLLVEEIHITKTQKQEIHTEDVTLKSEKVSVERQDMSQDAK